MVGSSRKSVGFKGIDAAETSPSISPSRRRRSIAAPKIVEENFGENDDEAERLAMREKNASGSPISNSVSSGTGYNRRQSLGLSSISNLSEAEIKNQITECIKLSAENKINDRNAFQLKMIDFLLYTLKKQDPNMTNLQVASVSLDASAKIYGFRVDKVHSDLLKVIGMAKDKKGEEEDQVEDQVDLNKKDEMKKKKKKNRQNIISTVDSLKGNVETYDPLSLIRYARDTQTSDMLFQAGLPQHANQGITLNLYNDVILDTVSSNSSSSKAFKDFSTVVDDFENQHICPSYAAFKFDGWSPDNDTDETNHQTEENDGEFHFDLDAVVPDADVTDHDVMMDCDDVFEERCDYQQRNNVENIVDFQEIIANNPNPNATYEYSYLQRSYRIQWAGPSHWKVTLNRNLGNTRIIEACKQNAKKSKKEIELSLTKDSKEAAKFQLDAKTKQAKLLPKTTKGVWSEDKVTTPQDMHHNIKHYCTFFNKPSECLKFHDNRIKEPHLENNSLINDNEDNLEHNSFGDHFGDHFENDDDRLSGDFHSALQDVANISGTQTQGAFIGDNLVAAPKLTDKIFIPYSQRAKKIDMRQLKKVMWKSLKESSKENEKENFDITQAVENENVIKIKPKTFSNMYLEVPKMLSKPNAESLSPAIAFVSLLHLANEKNFKIDRNPDLSDLHVKDSKVEA